MSVLVHEESKALLAELPEPKDVWEYMCMMFETPRPSSKEEQVRKKCIAIAENHNLDWAVDSAGNLRLRKPASHGCENAVAVAIQAHMDMVCSQTEDSTHDFEKDPLFPKVVDNGEWVKAPGTTLGADNGIGVAGALALLTDKELKHGPLEALFTTEEETTMGGAENVEPYPFLQAQAMINVDSEIDHSVCVGCAGGFEMKLSIPAIRRNVASSGLSCLMVEVSGLVGGHTGIDIDSGRANALRVLARALASASSPTQFRCASDQLKPPADAAVKEPIPIHLANLAGGNAVNAIPRSCAATLWVSTGQAQELQRRMQFHFSQLQGEFAVVEARGRAGEEGSEDKKAADEDLEASPWQMTITEASESPQACCPEDSQKILDFVLAVPHGVLRFSPDVANAVDTSIAFSLCGMESGSEQVENKFWTHLFCRSYSDFQMKKVKAQLEGFARLTNASVSDSMFYFNGWEPNIASPLVQQTLSTHQQLFGTNAKVYSVHAGLECGPLMLKYPQMHCVSIGPLILGAHSPDEKIKISTVMSWYKWLRGTVEGLADVPASDFGV